MTHLKRLLTLDTLALAAPFTLYILHALYFGRWIIDDAGISYAYARSLAQGFGLVSQPGMPPVEGFTNFAWVLLLAPFFWLRLFDPIVTPKLIGMALTGITFWVATRTLQQVSTHPRLATAVVLTLLAFNTSFVVWSISGLENPLTACLTTLLLYRLTTWKDALHIPARAARLALLAFLITLTRPDGVLFAGVYPVLLGLAMSRQSGWFRSAVRAGAVYAGVFALALGGLTLFRWLYFGDLIPNTFYVKGEGMTENLVHLLLLTPDAFQRVFELFYSVLSYLGGFLMAGMGIAITALMAQRQFPAALLPALLMTLAAMAHYALMPLDWMGEARFSTAFYVPFLILAFGMGETTLKSLPLASANRNRLVFLSLTFTLLTAAAAGGVRSQQYASLSETNQGRQINFDYITTEYALRFNRYAEALGVQNGSLLLPDMGGTLYYSTLKVYDLVGLTDRTIARTRQVNPPAFYDYIFETVKPTFIHTHGPWAYQARLDADPRFRRDYLPIREQIDPYVLKEYGEQMYAGDYVRREVANQNPDAFAALRANP